MFLQPVSTAALRVLGFGAAGFLLAALPLFRAVLEMLLDLMA